MFSQRRIVGLLRQEWYISKRSLEIIVDVVFFAVIDILVFGYASLYLLGTSTSIAGQYFIFGALWWEVIRIAQYTMTVGSLWNVWSRNLSNMFIAPISLAEYIFVQMFSGFWKSGVIVFFLLMPLAYGVFHFNVLSIGMATILAIFCNLLLFSWSVGLVLLGMVFRYGTRVQALGWAFIFIFQPLGAVFYPVDILPPAIQGITRLLPITYVFEGGRAALLGLDTVWHSMSIAFALNSIYFVAALIIFRRLLHRAQDTGQFARNEM